MAAVKDGVDAWQRGDYASAVAIWRPLAQAGDGDAAFNLAQAYKLGRGVPTDLGQAKTWYGKAAQAGHVQGAANYGLLLFQDGDRRSAMPWIEKAATAGDPRAQYVFGTALFNGDLASRDWPKAYALMTRAAAAGLPQATTSLSQMDQYMSADDRQKGMQLATQMASQPVPPTGRKLVTGGTDIAVGPISPAEPSDLSAAPPPLKPVKTRAAPTATAAATATVQPPARPVAAKPAPAVVASAGGKWQVQLGAYGSQDGAATAWRKVAGKLGGLAPSYQKAGAVVRLRAGPLADKGAAEKACAAAKAGGAACFPVAP
jgi:cell division septation protein DedD